mgnify:CR=1 FL=1
MIINFKINYNDLNLFQPIKDNIYSFFSDEKGPFEVSLLHKGKIICKKELDNSHIAILQLLSNLYNRLQK